MPIMTSSEDQAALIKLLKERGHTDEEVKLILARVRQYDERTLHDSVMDSIGAGRMNLDALIKEALED